MPLLELTAAEAARLIRMRYEQKPDSEYWFFEFHADECDQTITVFRHRSAISGWGAALIRWPSRSAIAPESARIFVSAMRMAINKAADLNRESHPESDYLH